MTDDQDLGSEIGADESEDESRSVLEGLMPGLLKKALSSGAEVLADDRLRETIVAEAVRKAISKGGEVVDQTEESVRKLIGEIPLSKELADRVAGRLDDYKSEVTRVLKDEIHTFLDRIDLGHELQKALTSLSLEISTEIRFIPNEKGVEAKVPVKPEVKSRTRVKRASSGRTKKKTGHAESQNEQA